MSERAADGNKAGKGVMKGVIASNFNISNLNADEIFTCKLGVIIPIHHYGRAVVQATASGGPSGPQVHGG